MTDPPDRSIEERLASLEATVRSLQRLVEGPAAARAGRAGDRASTPPGAVVTSPRPEAPDRARPARAPAGTPAAVRAQAPSGFAALLARPPQFWISRIGIGLLLAGVAYLFKYAVDQGWLTPPIRVAFGVALGAALAIIGFRVQRQERWFSQVMAGGAAATWYITGFAAFQLLHVVSFPIAFAFMVLVTAFTFWSALRQDEAVLAVLAAVGGLGTPFFLYTEAGSVPGLMAYTCLVLLGTSAIYLFKGWQSLLWTTALGACLVVALGFRTDAFPERVALQTGIVVIWLLFWLVPVGRELLVERDPARWGRAVRAARPLGGAHWIAWSQGDLAVLVVAAAVLALFASRAVWTVGDVRWGAIALVGSGGYVLAARRLS